MTPEQAYRAGQLSMRKRCWADIQWAVRYSLDFNGLPFKTWASWLRPTPLPKKRRNP